MKELQGVKYFPHFFIKNGKKLVAIGDGNIITKKKYDIAVIEGKKKCKVCGHTQNDHYGVCRFTEGLMYCQCQGFE